MTRTAVILAALFVFAATVPVPAHHSYTSFWYTDREVEINGVVKEVKLVNPHSEITVEVASGPQAGTWYITSRATGSALRRGGWTPETLPVGTAVKVSGYPPRKEGSKALAAGTIILPDGKKLSFGGDGGIPQG